MAKRVCAESGCPELTDSTRCPAHTRARDKARGTRQARGYDAEYGRLKREYERRISRGEVLACVRCGEGIDSPPVTPDHNAERTGYLGPSHQACNLRAAGLARHGKPWRSVE